MRIILVVCLLLAGCTAPAPKSGGDILAMGDSAMAWNAVSGQSIGHAMGKSLKREVVNTAVSGAIIMGGPGRLNIPSQYTGGKWNWIVVNGGANDLGLHCGCGACASTVNRLISADATRGAIPALLTRLRASGARVLWMGYYEAAKGGYYKGCRHDIKVLEERIARFAARTDGVFFLDAEGAIDPTDFSNFTRDRTHPSARGSARVGAYLARFIAAQR